MNDEAPASSSAESDEIFAAPEVREVPKRRRWLFVLAGAVVVVLLLAGAAFAYVVHEVNPGHPGAPITVTIPPGSSGSEIATILADRKVITSRRIFRAYTKVVGLGIVQSGQYKLRRHMNMGAVLDTLHAGPFVKYEALTVPEGLTLEQIAERVGKLPGRSSATFLADAKNNSVRSTFEPANVSSLEGLLFPDTYRVTEREDEAAILRRMVSHFDDVANGLQLPSKAAAIQLTPYQVITVASLIEAEAKVPDDRPLIASVIRNRLARHMKLQIDATVLYALGTHKQVVLLKDLEINSPYNTYKIDGLPPTPIGAAGEASLRAVLEAPQTDYLYYVLIDANGKHGFARTEAEFNALLAQAHRNGVR